MAAYAYGRPERITEQSFGKQAQYRKPLVTLPYAEAFGRIGDIPATGPGDAVYLRQLEGAGKLRNKLTAGLAGELANIETNRSLQTLMAKEAQRSARFRDEEARLKRTSGEQQELGRTVSNEVVELVKLVGQMDKLAREATEGGLPGLIDRDVARRKAAAADRADPGPSRLELLQLQHQRPVSESYGQEYSAGLGLQRELDDMYRQKREYEELRLGDEMSYLQEFPDEPWINPVTNEPLIVNGRPITNAEAAEEYYEADKRPRTRFEIDEERALRELEGEAPYLWLDPSPRTPDEYGRTFDRRPGRQGTATSEVRSPGLATSSDPWAVQQGRMVPAATPRQIEDTLGEAGIAEAVKEQLQDSGKGYLAPYVDELMSMQRGDFANALRQLGFGSDAPSRQQMFFGNQPLNLERALQLISEEVQDPRLRVRGR
jgi:hypothetical protein